MVHEILRVRHDLAIKPNQRRVFKPFSKLSHQGESPVCLDAHQRYLGQRTPTRLRPLLGLHAPRVAFGIGGVGLALRWGEAAAPHCSPG